MKLSRAGLSFKYHGDEILRYWPWARAKYQAPYHSQLFSRDFNSFNEYWKIIGEESTLTKISTSVGRMHGFDLRDVVASWSARLWINEYLVIMIEPDPAKKGPAFWSRLDLAQRNTLMNGIVVLRCKDTTEATTLLESIDPGYSDAMIVFNWKVWDSNDEFWDYT